MVVRTAEESTCYHIPVQLCGSGFARCRCRSTLGWKPFHTAHYPYVELSLDFRKLSEAKCGFDWCGFAFSSPVPTSWLQVASAVAAAPAAWVAWPAWEEPGALVGLARPAALVVWARVVAWVGWVVACDALPEA